MSDILYVELEDLKSNFCSYKNKKVKIKECPFYINSKAIYPNYYLDIGKEGGVRIIYGDKKSLTVNSYCIINHNELGIYDDERIRYANLILPIDKAVPTTLQTLKNRTENNLATYRKSYVNAKKRLAAINDVLKDYPEHLV